MKLRTTVRHCLAAVGIGIPLILRLLTFLAVQSFSLSPRLDRLGDRIDRMEHPGKP